APAIPLLFMGEEYGETAPFQFFTSFLDRDLAEAVKKGRAEEFSRFAWQGAVPDPGEPATFVRSRLNHPLAGAPRHRELSQYYRRWLALRRSHPALGARGKERAQATVDAKGTMLTLSREAESGAGLRLLANLTNEARQAPSVPADWRLLLDSDDPRFAGQGRPALAPFQTSTPIPSTISSPSIPAGAASEDFSSPVARGEPRTRCGGRGGSSSRPASWWTRAPRRRTAPRAQRCWAGHCARGAPRCG